MPRVLLRKDISETSVKPILLTPLNLHGNNKSNGVLLVMKYRSSFLVFTLLQWCFINKMTTNDSLFQSAFTNFADCFGISLFFTFQLLYSNYRLSMATADVCCLTLRDRRKIAFSEILYFLQLPEWIVIS